MADFDAQQGLEEVQALLSS